MALPLGSDGLVTTLLVQTIHIHQIAKVIMMVMAWVRLGETPPTDRSTSIGCGMS